MQPLRESCKVFAERRTEDEKIAECSGLYQRTATRRLSQNNLKLRLITPPS